MMIPTEYEPLVKRAKAMEELVSHPAWIVFVQMVNEQRDRWLEQTQRTTDRDYLSAQATTANILTKAPFDCIETKENLLKQLVLQEEAERRAAMMEAAELAGTSEAHPPPQAA